MALNPSIILAGQAPDVMGAMSAGLQQAQNQLAFDRQNALQDLYRTQGAQIMAGDQAALNQLAQFDPMAAMDVQGVFMDRERQARQDARTAVTDSRADQEWEWQVEEYKKGITAEQAAAEAAKIEEAVKMGLMAQTPEQWDALMGQLGQSDLVGQFGNREAIAGRYMSVADVLKRNEPGDPLTTEAKLAADFQAGRIDQATYEAGLARLAPKGTSLTVDPTTGAVTFQEGVGVGGAGGTTSGDALRTQITDARSMLDMISNIANDPALPGVTGPVEGGGGNNVDEFGVLQRMYYGDAGLGVIQKIAQLQGNAWLGARALLKGGGAITDYESKKAESAMARLSRAQGDAEFQAALKDLEDALREGIKKLEGSAQPVAPTAAPATGNTTSSGVEWSIE